MHILIQDNELKLFASALRLMQYQGGLFPGLAGCLRRDLTGQCKRDPRAFWLSGQATCQFW